MAPGLDGLSPLVPEGVVLDGELLRLRFVRRDGVGLLPRVSLVEARAADAFGREIPLTLGQTVAALPAALALHAPVPNPFNPETTLRFALPEAAETTLVIHDAAGQEVRTVVAGHLPAGVHAATWDGRDATGQEVASGVHFAQLAAGAQVATREFVLLR